MVIGLVPSKMGRNWIIAMDNWSIKVLAFTYTPVVVLILMKLMMRCFWIISTSKSVVESAFIK